jgi:hypothetical protein
MGHVYLISFENPILRSLNPYIKIGISKDSKKRISSIQTGSPLKLKFYGFIESDKPIEIEKFLHKLLAKERVCGEWFKFSLALIDAIRTRYSVQDDLLNELFLSVEGPSELLKIKGLERELIKLRKELKEKDRTIIRLREELESELTWTKLFSDEAEELEKKLKALKNGR